MHMAPMFATWELSALCGQSDPALFFPKKGTSPDAAKRICGRCEVIAECHERVMRDPAQAGVWAGTSQHDRVQAMRAGVLL